MDIFLNNFILGISKPAPQKKLLKPPEIKPLTKKIFSLNIIFLKIFNDLVKYLLLYLGDFLISGKNLFCFFFFFFFI